MAECTVLLKFVPMFSDAFQICEFMVWCFCFDRIRFGSLYYIIILKRTHTVAALNSRCMHLHRVSISILIVANGNIRVDLNGIARCGMVWYGVLLWWLEKQSEYTEQRWQRHVHEFPIENSYNQSKRRALHCDTDAETIETNEYCSLNSDFVWFNRILWHFVPYNWIVVSKRCIPYGHFHVGIVCACVIFDL